MGVLSLSGRTKQRASELATLYLQLARDQVGNTHGHLKEAWDSVEVGPREKKLALGLRKLIEDKCEFEAAPGVDPRKLRRDVFELGAKARRDLGRDFDRRKVFEDVAPRFDAEPEALDAALYADLPSQHRLLQVPTFGAAELTECYQTAQYQAVLLRAVKLVAHVRSKDPQKYRALFRALKFRRLMYVIHREGEGYRIEIDGPFSLFESVTKYGLQLALLFPVLCQCDELRLVAELKWGKQRTALRFEYDHEHKGCAVTTEPLLRDDVGDLMQALLKLDSGWRVSINEQILDLPGVGLCVPDLCFDKDGKRVLLEVLGFWSRDAVWRRVELVEKGLAEPTLFAVSSRLRVSEAVLDETQCSALYVYKGVMSARAVLERVNGLAGA